MREIEAFCMKWKYWPNRCYSGTYKGYEIVLRRIPKTINGMNWRLSVHRVGDSGIGLAFERQFHRTSVDGRFEGKELVDRRAP